MKHAQILLSCLFGFSAFSLSTPMTAQTDYPINFDPAQEYTRPDRHLDAMTLSGSTDGSQTLYLQEPRKVYTALLDQSFTARAGETLTASFGFSGTWMHGYVYLDRGNDGSFEATLGSKASIPAGSDIMAFSCAPYDGNNYNSAGQTVTNLDVLNPPSFRLPENLKPGYYRMRFKVDWNDINPAGCMVEGNSILKNGGAIFDVRLNIHGDHARVSAQATNGTVTSLDGGSLDQSKQPFGQPLKLRITPHEGYVCDGLRVRHGYQLQGDSLLHGTPQYVDVNYPGYLIQNGVFTLPAEVMDGEVVVEPLFIPATNAPAGSDDYALNFDKAQPTDHKDHLLKTVLFQPQNGKRTTLSIKDTALVYQQLHKQIGIIRGNAMNISLNYQGTPLHAYFYVDLNNDGRFTPNLTSDGRPSLSGELLSYTYYQGRNSLGETTESTVAQKDMPVLTIPAALPVGVYRARLKLDTDNIDPAGRWTEGASDNIDAQGGYIIDLFLNVVNETHRLDLVTTHGNIYGTSTKALPRFITPFNRLEVNPVGITKNYEAETLRIRHGHNFEGPQYIHGNPQWSEYSVKGKRTAIPSDSINGDVIIYADFQPNSQAEYELVFSDEFNAPDGSQPESTKWIRCQRQGATWNRWLSDSKEVIFQEDGQLVARAIPNPDQKSDPVPMITGGIKSMGKFGFTYGKVECRALSNPWVGNFPAIWMMPEDQRAGWPDCGEIDIWEVIDAQETSYHTIHSNWTYDLGHKNEPQSSFNVPVALDRYHTYGLEWDETSLKWYVDGDLVGTYRKSTNKNHLDQGQWPFDKHFHLILNQSVGNGSWAANADVNHVYETRFDWIRVYQKKGQENTKGTVGIAAHQEDNTCEVNILQNGIAFHSQQPTQVQIADLSGRTIFQQTIQGSMEVKLERGIYIVNQKKVMIN